MNIHPLRRSLRWLLGLALLLAGLQWAQAQDDAPGQVGYLNYRQGTLSYSPAGDDSWYDVIPNRPLTSGDRLWTDRNARAEVYVGSTAFRMGERASLEFTELGDQTVRVTVQQGSVSLHVRDLPAGQRLELDTDNLALVVNGPGEYRVDVDSGADITQVALAAGSATVYGENGAAVPLAGRQQLAVTGRDLAAVGSPPMQWGDAFDRWVAERDRVEAQSVSAQYVPRDVVGYQQLDQYGSWQDDPQYGAVWYPADVAADWVPYQDGQWVDVAPWGWTWVDVAPWGFAPFHYGRWARIGPRWCWVPGRLQPGRAAWAPALVGFVGGAPGPGFAPGGARPDVGWFPLAPGEAWRPAFHASARYVDRVNQPVAFNRPLRTAGFLNQALPGAVTMVPVERFGRGPMISRRDLVPQPPAEMARLPVAAAPPIAMPSHLAGAVAAGTLGALLARPAVALPPAPLRMAPPAPARGMAAPAPALRPGFAMPPRTVEAARPPQPGLPSPRPAMPQGALGQRLPPGAMPPGGPPEAGVPPQMRTQPQDAWRQQNDLRQRMLDAQRQQQEMQGRATEVQRQQQMQPQAMQQQELQPRTAEAQRQQQIQAQQQQELQQRAMDAQRQQQLQQQQVMRQQQEMQMRAAAQQQMMAAQQQGLRQAQEAQQRALQQQAQQAQQRRGFEGRPMPQRGDAHPGEQHP